MGQARSNAGNLVDRIQAMPMNAVPLGFAQLTAMTAAKTLAAHTGGIPIPAGAAYVTIQAEAQNIRYRDDGNAPTAAIGMLLVAGTSMTYSVKDFSVLQLIAATAGAIANISYYGE